MKFSHTLKSIIRPAVIAPVLLASTLVAAMPAQAGSPGYNSHHNGYSVDSAPVTHVEPIYETVRIETPRRECRTEAVERRARHHGSHRQAKGHSYTPQLIGAVIGAGLGRKFGSGRGKDLGTVAGAVLGASVGRDINRDHRRRNGHHSDYHAADRTYVEHVEVCEDVSNFHDEQRVIGYKVQYRYNGQDYWTETDRDPGDRIEVRVSVSPVNS